MFTKWTAPYYLENLYDLFYQNKDEMDWFGEWSNVVVMLLRHYGIKRFGTNSGRWYVEVTDKQVSFPYQPEDAHASESTGP
jgi:hypothetical protein